MRRKKNLQLLFESEEITEIRRNFVVKYTPMVTLTEISTSAIARVLDRNFLTDREFCKENPNSIVVDYGATRENTRADDRSLFERLSSKLGR